ncbi:hypothetical protein MTO96_043090, partial [Rhipicephalus appendiculatus]
MVRWYPVRRIRFIRRCVVILAVSSCATLVGFQMMMTTCRDRRLPPWRQQLPGATEVTGSRQGRSAGDQDGRESRTERDRRIMERQIFRDSEEADHRHDDLSSSWSSDKLPWFFTNGTEWPRPSSKLSRLRNVWPDPQSPHDDRIVAQLMYLPPGIQGTAQEHQARVIIYLADTTYAPKDRKRNDALNETTTMKNIILHGSWHDFLSGRELFLRDRCPVDTCTVYRDYEARLGEQIHDGGGVVDAVIYKDFYGGEDHGTIDGRQVKILYLLENPTYTFVPPGDTGIDWTATY